MHEEVDPRVEPSVPCAAPVGSTAANNQPLPSPASERLTNIRQRWDGNATTLNVPQSARMQQAEKDLRFLLNLVRQQTSEIETIEAFKDHCLQQAADAIVLLKEERRLRQEAEAQRGTIGPKQMRPPIHLTDD